VRELTPREIVAELDRYIVGQEAAKRAVAVAVRNRWRRQQLGEEMRREIAPRNILMIGPTGVGKTEIARRLARLTGAPFVKVEATKYTEVGYYGRDVESMVRDLIENAIGLVREEERQAVKEEATRRAENRLLALLAPSMVETGDAEGAPRRRRSTREKMRAMLRAGELDDRLVEISVERKAMPLVMTGIGTDHIDLDIQNMFEKFLPKQNVRTEVPVREARKLLFEQECDALINEEQLHQRAIRLAENLGIIFIDEIDKVVASEGGKGPDVSRQGVQRDLLPIVEGTTVQTRYGYVRTDHVLFVAAGAFHKSSPSDLMPELQGRFPIRVELSALTKADFIRILTEPRNALLKQYEALLATENVTLRFTPDAVEALAEYAFQLNQSLQNIGARRLYTIMERLVEDLSFDAPERAGSEAVIDAAYVRQRLEPVVHNQDLSQFIL
jgi:ATP-dependent HslUV protease ATP-binding subunit HslU